MSTFFNTSPVSFTSNPAGSTSSTASSSPPTSQSAKEFPPLPGSHSSSSGPVVRQQPQTSAPAGWDAEVDYRYGLRGLVDRSRMQNPDALLTCGINLAPLFEEQQRRPDAPLSSFLKQPTQPMKPQNAEIYQCAPRFPVAKIPPQAVDEHVLFFLFYGMPRDRMQSEAARTLLSNGWYYHKDLQTWMKRTPGAPHVRLEGDWERGSWQFFDVNEWRMRKIDDLVISLRCLQGASH